MNENIYIEVHCQQLSHTGERICGDVFQSKRIKEEKRLIAVLSDGMGHGVKANVLATLTATMAYNFTAEHKDAIKIAEIIMNTLPVCSERSISYSTFTIIDIDSNGETSILEYDNPESFILRGNKLFSPNWQCLILESDKNAGKELRYCSFHPQKEDRIVFCTDGVTQAGLGSDKYAFGWGLENLHEFVLNLIASENDISAKQLSAKVVNTANRIDGYASKDDTSCAVIYFRQPRRLLICTGPPFEEENDKVLAEKVKEFKGKKIICGATTSDIISRELNEKITDSFEFHDPDLPPVSHMPGVDLITEGILTMGKVAEILKTYKNSSVLGKGPADLIVKMLLESDAIDFVIGTKINEAHQDPNLPVELEIRRTVVKRVVSLLEKNFLKEVHLEYI